MYSNQKGFTLIELLVVVLIIGILAAVALPQYQKAVDKSQIAPFKSIAASVKSAEEVYYLANGQYTIDASQLDIDLSCEKTNDPGVFICGKSIVVDLISGASSTESATIDIYFCPGKAKPWDKCATTHRELIYRTWLDFSNHPGKRECSPQTTRGTELCKTLADN